MATLETQYKNYQSENPDSTLTFDEWLKQFGNGIKKSLDEMFERVRTPEYREQQIKKKQEYLEKVSMDFQLGFFVGEYIVHRFLPTLSTDGLHSRNVINVSEEDAVENKRLSDEWLNTTRYGSNFNEESENGDKEKWELYHQHNKMLEKKYLPQTLETGIQLIRIDNEEKFKEGLRHSLWNCDMCSYDIEPENIKIENDLFIGYTTITFQYKPDTDVEE